MHPVGRNSQREQMAAKRARLGAGFLVLPSFAEEMLHAPWETPPPHYVF